MVGLAYNAAGGPGRGGPGQEGGGGGLPGGETYASGVRAHFTRAALTPAPTTQGHWGQEVVYTFQEGITLKAAEAIKMALDEGSACMANCTYHVQPSTGDTWHYAFPGDDGMESIAPLGESERQGTRYEPSAKLQKNGCGRREE